MRRPAARVLAFAQESRGQAIGSPRYVLPFRREWENGVFVVEVDHVDGEAVNMSGARKLLSGTK